MDSPNRLPRSIRELLRCPICRAKLRADGESLICEGRACHARFPVIDGVPVLLNEAGSVFSIADFVAKRSTYFKSGDDSRKGKLRDALRRLVPAIGENLEAQENFGRLARLLLEQTTHPRVLVLGGSILGQGMEALVEDPDVELVDTDVSFGPRTSLICDAHDIPFDDESFDGVVAQAVLEHVADPYRCVAEIHRVLDHRGLIYAETPFMQQVHGGRYDFTRFTHLGHRRLFRTFDEIDSGAVSGPGTALAWSYQYFLLSFTASRMLRDLILAFSGLTAFFLKYFDRYLIDKPAALDAASGYYFLGRKGSGALPDAALIELYRGAV